VNRIEEGLDDLEGVSLFAVHARVDSGNLVFVLHPEAECLLNGEADDEGHDEGVDENRSRCDQLNNELFESAAEEQASLGGEEAEEQGSNETTDEVDADDVE
jgi:hypothetical protein